MNANNEEIDDAALNQIVGGTGGPPGTAHKQTTADWAAAHPEVHPLSVAAVINEMNHSGPEPLPASHPPLPHRP